jgi:putative FmdB family regulatory protein
MPIYEYECLGCGRLSEFIEGVYGEGADKVCSHCGGIALKRILSKGVTSRSDGMIGNRGGKTCCGREERCGSPPCSEPGACCK